LTVFVISLIDGFTPTIANIKKKYTIKLIKSENIFSGVFDKVVAKKVNVKKVSNAILDWTILNPLKKYLLKKLKRIISRVIKVAIPLDWILILLEKIIFSKNLPQG
tara:strand:- start:772 stop:1089 length:318 start_codon:yes stop_codon:yes gene_type:complete